jgi:Calcium binding
MPRSRKPSNAVGVQIGAKVRVKSGIRDPDFPDIPLGGWSGTITEVGTKPPVMFLIEWDRRTLAQMHPVYRKRCERDGLEFEAMWLGEEDIEPDDGASVPIEQPTEIKTPPLSEKDQDDRVRKVFGLTHDDPLPDVSRQTLLTYHRYLTANLKFPFNAYYGEEEVGQFARKRATIAVSGLLDPVRKGLDEEDGLFCKGRGRGEKFEVPLAEIEVRKKDPNFKLISDYAYWFVNWPCQDESDIDWEDDGQDDPSGLYPTAGTPQPSAVGGNSPAFGRGPACAGCSPTEGQGPAEGQGRPAPGAPRSEDLPLGPWLVIKAVLVCGVGGGILGAAIGAAFKTFDGAWLAALIGGIPPGAIGALILGRYGIIFGAVNRIRFGALLGAVLGSLGGGLVGLVAGLTVLALPWSLLGLIAGLFLGPHVLAQKQQQLVSFRGGALGTCGGILISAFRHDQGPATAGAVSGAIIGSVAAAGLLLLLSGAAYLIPRTPMGLDPEDEDEEFEKVEEEDEDHRGGLRRRRF